MNEQLICRCIQAEEDALLRQVEATYTASFPENERRDFTLVRQLLEKEVFDIHALLKEDNYVGFISAWNFTEFVFIEHFAIDSSARNGGIGGRALKEFMAKTEKPIVLEVEVPVDEWSVRRIGFYQRLGFTLHTYPYKQPPFRPGDPWLDMHLMTCGDFDIATLNEVKAKLYYHVYGIAEKQI